MAHENYKNNEIIFRLYRNKEQDDNEKVKMTIRRKFALTDDISSYPGEVKWLTKFYYAKSAFPEESPFRKKWIKDNYVSLTIPLIPERKGGKLYFRTLSRKSYYSDKWERAYLHFTLNEEGANLIQSYRKRIIDLTSNPNSNQKSKDKMITKLRQKISKIENGIRYHSLSMNIRGLLDYASKERNYEEFKKTVVNLADSDEYQEIYPPYYQYDDRCEIPELRILRVVAYSSPYKIKSEFPFFSHYDLVEKLLPENFVKMLLEVVAKKLKKEDSLDIIKPEHLRYMVTEFFYRKIRSQITSKKEGNNDNDNLDSNEREMLLSYLSEIGQYVQYIKEEKKVRRENIQRSALLQHRYDKLHKEIRAVIDNNQDKEIIPIYKQIKEARIPLSYISEILKSIRNKYGNKFVITDSCSIAKSKAKELTALLAGNPTLDNACASLTKHGLHKHWTRSDFWYRLGFGCGYEDSDTEFKTPRVLKLKGIK